MFSWWEKFALGWGGGRGGEGVGVISNMADSL